MHALTHANQYLWTVSNVLLDLWSTSRILYHVGYSGVEMCTFLMSLTMSYPVMIAVPLDGLRSPVNILKVVVLPAPTHKSDDTCGQHCYTYHSLPTTQNILL